MATTQKTEPFGLDSLFILRVPEESAKKIKKCLSSDTPNTVLEDELKLEFDEECRNATVDCFNTKLQGKLLDLPCVIECQKTLDKKNFYKCGDVAQILVCKPESDAAEEESQKKDEKKFLYNHGITPPLKNVRRKRFRKTLRKKYMDAPDIEKELKSLLRADLEAVSVRWELVDDPPPSTSTATVGGREKAGPSTAGDAEKNRNTASDSGGSQSQPGVSLPHTVLGPEQPTDRDDEDTGDGGPEFADEKLGAKELFGSSSSGEEEEDNDDDEDDDEDDIDADQLERLVVDDEDTVDCMDLDVKAPTSVQIHEKSDDPEPPS